MAKGWRWWNSSRSRAVHRRPCSSTKRQRPPSRSCTARRTAAGMWREAGFVSVCERFLRGAFVRAEATGLEPFELLGDGVFDDGGEVGAGDGGAQEGLEPLELVAQPGAGGELDAVAPGGEGLDARQGSRGGGKPRTGRLRPDGASGARPRRFVPTQARLGRGHCVRTEFEGGAGDPVGARSPARRGRSDGRVASGSFRMRAGASGRGANSAASSSTWRFEQWVARFRTASRLSGVRCGASLADGGEVEPPVGEHGEEDRVLARRPGGGDAQVGFGLGEVEPLGAVGEHGRARPRGRRAGAASTSAMCATRSASLRRDWRRMSARRRRSSPSVRCSSERGGSIPQYSGDFEGHRAWGRRRECSGCSRRADPRAESAAPGARALEAHAPGRL